MSDDLDKRLAAALRATAESRAVDDRWEHVARKASGPHQRTRRSRLSLPLLVAAAVVVLGVLTAIVVSTTRTLPVSSPPELSERPSVHATTSISEEVRTPVQLLTSTWEPGSPGPGALLEGALSINSTGCVLVGLTVVVWPKDYTAFLRAGVLEVLDADGRMIARGGDTLAVGGGYTDEPATGPCQGTRGGVFQVGGAILTVGEPVTLPTSDWRPGDFTLDGLITGVLERGNDGCVTVGGKPVIWPAGWTARTTVAGVEILYTDGRTLAQSNQVVRAGGGFITLPPDSVTRCTPAEGTFTLMGDFKVTG